MEFNFANAVFCNLSVHFVGNRANNEDLVISSALGGNLTAPLYGELSNYLLSAFKPSDSYCFWHESDIDRNDVYTFASAIFSNPLIFETESVKIAKSLYEHTGHPSIRAGEFFVALFKQLIIGDEDVEALCLVKSEAKDRFIKTSKNARGVNITLEQGMNLNKVDKGCLIINTKKDSGYVVYVIDQTRRGNETVYWKEDFLGLKTRNDAYKQTSNVLGLYKKFITEEIDSSFDITKAEKIDLLNKSIRYFKGHENFEISDFSMEVISNPEGIKSFENYKKIYEQQNELEIPDSFEIVESAVKKQARLYKAVLKLDKNFHIYIHGSRNLIERGVDPQTGKNFYKIYFDQEQ